MIGRQLGRFTVTAPLGEGGMATVWRARDELLRRTVALKVLREHLAGLPEARRRFLHEARSASLLDHPGIVGVYDFGEAEGTAYIAFALVEGETLSARVARSLLPLPEAVRIVAEAAAALGHAHACGVVHRDVTGRNVLIARDGRVYLIDFGLALAAGQSRLTTANTALGTVTYMAPEVISSGPADARSDLYGLGVVLFEALTGSFPFVADRPEALFYNVVHETPRPPGRLRPEIPPALDRVVLRALAREPGARYADMEAFAAELRAVDLGATTGATSTTPAMASAPSSAEQPFEPADSGAVTRPLDAPRYLAVLPFEDHTADGEGKEDRERLGRGLAETLSASLAGMPGLHVIASTEPATRRDAEVDARSVARRLGANLLLSGTLRRSGSLMRVTWTVIDPERGQQVAGDTVDGSALRIFDLEDDLSRSVQRALRLEGAHTVALSRPRLRDPAAREHFLQALGYLQRHDDEIAVEGAITLLERLVASEGDMTEHHAALARAYLAKYRLSSQPVWESRAAGACQRALALDRGAPEVLVTLGDIATAAGRAEEAVAEYRRALALRPEAIEGWLGLARASMATDRMAEAREAAQRAIEIHPGDWRAHNLLGLAHYSQGHYAEALGPWARVVELTPDNALGHSNLGSALHRLDRIEEALASFRRAIDIKPHAWAYTNLGTVLYFMGRYDEAADAFRTATALSPADPLMWGNLGNACRWIPGQGTEAVAAVERAILLMRERLARNPEDAGSWTRLAGWLAAQGQRDEARAAVERALELAPDDVNCVALAGSTYFLLGERAESLRCFDQAVRNGYPVARLRRDPELAPLQEDPEFRRILECGPANVGSVQ